MVSLNRVLDILTSHKDAQAEELKNELDSLKAREKSRIKAIKDLKARIEFLQGQVNNPPKTEDMEVINAEQVCELAILIELCN